MTRELTIETFGIFESPIKAIWSKFHDKIFVLGSHVVYWFNPETLEIKPFYISEDFEFTDIDIHKNGRIALLLQSSANSEIKILSSNLFSVVRKLVIENESLQLVKFTTEGLVVTVSQLDKELNKSSSSLSNSESSLSEPNSEEMPNPENSFKIYLVDPDSDLSPGEGLIETTGQIIDVSVNEESGVVLAISQSGDVIFIPTQASQNQPLEESEESFSGTSSESSLEIISFNPRVIGNIGGGVTSFSIGLKEVSVSDSIQKRARIFVGSKPWSNDRWDSGEISTEKSSILYGGGDNLIPGYNYWVHVSVWHEDSGWSSPQIRKFTMPYRYYEDYSSESSQSSSSLSSSSSSSSTEIMTTSSSESSFSSSSFSSDSSDSSSSKSSSSMSSSSMSSSSSRSSSSISSSSESSSSVSSSSSSIEDSWQFSLINSNTEIRIDKYIGSKLNPTIPDTIHELPVTTIGPDAFADLSTITSVQMSDNITSIEGAWSGGAFKDCTSLNSVTLSNNLVSLGQFAFHGCTDLTTLSIPTSVTQIGTYALAGTGLTSIVLPNSVTVIEHHLFYPSLSLETVTIGTGVTTIENTAFGDCPLLTSINLPNSLTSIQSWAFYACNSLNNVTIPNSITVISSKSFENCTSLSTITIGNGVVEIQEDAFKGDINLTSMTFAGNAPTTIGTDAFASVPGPIYYHTGASGWSDPWYGIHTIQIP